jgi:hypothetical protein
VGAGYGLLLLQTKFPIELINAPAGIHQLLLAGIKGVTLRADFNFDVRLRAPRLNNLSASASDCRLLVFGMDPFLHNCSPLPEF